MPRYAITTFGCQMNVHDSERMHEVLRRAGYTESEDPKAADVVVLNTCSVREKAEQKLLSEVGRLAKWKQTHPEMVLVVAGCVAQQEGERLLTRSQGIDLVLGPDNIPELPRLLDDIGLGAPPLVRTVFDLEAPRFLTALFDEGGSTPTSEASPPVAARAPTAFVTTMKGCNERCSFCIVPYTRGPERYRPSAEIVAEIAGLVEAGVREVTLLGQTVNSYRDPSSELSRAPGASPDDPDESEFAALLRRIAAEVPGLVRLRYTSPHPRHLTPSLIEAHAELTVLARHVHMPVQSGSDRILKRMIRRYTRAEYVARVGSLVARLPDLSLSTDIIVGFPGETEEDFAATLSLVREVGFRGLFGFKYSQRPYTPARKLADDVPEAEKSERLARLFEVSEELLGAHLQRLAGSRQRVLVEGAGKEGTNAWTGRTERNEIVHVVGAERLDLRGSIVEVVITRANKHSLQAELSDEARAAAKPLPAAPPAAPVEAPKPRAAGERRSLPIVAAGGG
ncbi:tRNA (N6-isopentenyl adenosine(37)-C2)-methylthiotransferase MiaB [Polyangium mundeleinium]|uniref:tRNA-2-methylthio-N(6)-dimethylallyladenosine synthase n=1 Tax=Polyangium mundeleinium TaxID=2995306 RepID=A0ABT5EXY4_9BACT|nr:tRNA (N6-isopentenyl adenosine(37)-C2)-methylthiotransferase MiaB [Polyangium mundeleinium]MDC0746656.1 tRNA (N6-isopentenyl adenosine(37)-C2)-methylthiotransferase MiaB [Polyangium mundeleinium]